MSSGGTLRKVFDPSSIVLDKVSDKNALKGAINPGGIALKNIEEGNVHNASDITNPDGSFRKTSAQLETIKAADEYAAGAPDRAANDSTDAANQALINRKRRRQSGLGSLATGATSGGAQLSSPTTYGKSTLGA